MEREYSGFIKLFVQAADNEDIPMLDILLTHVYPLLNNNTLKSLDNGIADVMLDASEEVKNKIMQHLAISEKAALDCVRGSLYNPDRDRSALPRLCESIGKNYGAALYFSLVYGDLDLATLLAEKNNYRKVEVGCGVGSRWYRPELDGVRVERPHTEKQNVKSIEEVKALIKIASQCGFQDLVGLTDSKILGTFLYEKNSDVAKLSRPEPFHRIPVIKQGCLHDPELAIAFDGANDPVKRIFGRVPCLVPVDEILPEQSVFEPRCVFHIKGFRSDSEFEIISPMTLSDPNLDLRQMQLKIDLGLEEKSSKENSDATLVELVVNQKIKHGFIPDGYRLVVVNTSDLLELPFYKIDPELLESAHRYADNFCPIDYIIATHEDLQDDEINKPALGINQGTATDLSEAFCNDELSSSLTERFPNKEFWRNILSRSARKANFILKARDMGFSLSDIGASRIRSEELEILYNSGFKIEEPNPFYHLDVKPKDFEICLEMGGWPYPDHPDTEEAFEAVMRRKNDSVFAHFIKYKADIDEVISLCTTHKRWETMTDLLGVEAMQPYVEKAPEKLRRRFIETDLGL